ncbi:MAG: primosomal protein N' [Actinobacteria bacterium]|nr:MAG: primosomal protein N' [Actinomycetota bacterium]
MKVAQVIVDIPSYQIDYPFNYLIPSHLSDLKVGQAVMVPFRNSIKQGWIVGFLNETDSSKQLKTIKELVSGQTDIDEVMLRLVFYISKRYLAPLSDALKLVLPPGKKPIKARKKIEHIYTDTLPKVKLSKEQAVASKAIIMAINNQKHHTFLIQGKTASGKTEVYFQAIRQCIKKGKSAIYLVPEISLTPQLIARLKSRFGDEVAVLHSNMTDGQRYDQWRCIKECLYSIVVGARSAIFAPVKKLGLVIIDEEHETTYKQNNSPRYHCRHVAIKRAQLESAVVVMGSASPQIESRYFCDKKVFSLLTLKDRVTVNHQPEIEIVDMCENKNVLLSKPMIDGIRKTLDQKSKALVFLNRRGFANFMLCTDCGFVPKCQSCAVSLTFHRDKNRLVCHHCNFTSDAPLSCPKCKKPGLKYYGVGTQQVEDQLMANFKDADIVRMDADSTRKRGSHQDKILEFVNSNKAILLGTQMIAKGLDFPDIDFVGIINADTGLNLPDFRAEEKTFQLILQVIGRTGRRESPGKVVVQTFNPDNETLKLALAEDYNGFYRSELQKRKDLLYPPYAHLVNVIVKGPKCEKVSEIANRLAVEINKAERFMILGPSACPLTKIKDNYRYHILLKTKKVSHVALLKTIVGEISLPKSHSILIDVDPMSML